MDGAFDPRPQYHEPPAGGAEPAARATPSPRQQSWGTVISIVLIVLMIVVGALYAWGKRVAQERALLQQISTTTPAH